MKKIFNTKIRNQNNRAFTLIELLVVVAIIGILSSLVLASLNSARDKARLAAGKQADSNILHALGDMMVGEWRFDECSGSVAQDTSGNSINLTLVGNPVWSSNTSSGKGCALDFNGSTQYAYATDPSALDLADNFTVSAWVYLENNTSKILVSKSNSVEHGVFLGHGFGGNGFVFGVHNVVNSPYGNSGCGLNCWNFVVAVSNNNNRDLFVNGSYVGSSFSAGGSWFNGLDFTIGSDASYAYKADAIIDNVRVYSKTLTASEVSSVYLAEIDNFSRKIAKK